MMHLLQHLTIWPNSSQKLKRQLLALSYSTVEVYDMNSFIEARARLYVEACDPSLRVKAGVSQLLAYTKYSRLHIELTAHLMDHDLHGLRIKFNHVKATFRATVENAQASALHCCAARLPGTP